MSSTFDAAFAFAMRAEGKLSKDPDDPGGLTYRGIAMAKNPGWPGWKTVLAVLSRPITADQINRILDADQYLQGLVQSFYRSQFWDKIDGDQLPPPDAFFLFDGAVNCGCHRAIEWLQRAVGTSVDGVLGPATLAAAAAHPDVLHAIEQARENYYRSMDNPNRTDDLFDRFGRGWLSRSQAAEAAARSLVTT